MKTCKEWLMDLPDGYRELAIVNIAKESNYTRNTKHNSLPEALGTAFTWKDSPEGWNFWNKVFGTIVDNGSLPPLTDDTFTRLPSKKPIDLRAMAQETIKRCMEASYGSMGSMDHREGDYGTWKDWEDVLVGFGEAVLREELVKR